MLLVADGIDDVDEAFFNGVQVGANGSMPGPLYGDPSSDIRRPFVIHPENEIRYGIRLGLSTAWRVYCQSHKAPPYVVSPSSILDEPLRAWSTGQGDDFLSVP